MVGGGLVLPTGPVRDSGGRLLSHQPLRRAGLPGGEVGCEVGFDAGKILVVGGGGASAFSFPRARGKYVELPGGKSYSNGTRCRLSPPERPR